MSWTVVKKLKEDRAAKFAEATALRELAAKENRDLTSDEDTKHTALISEVENFAKRIEREERANALGEQLNVRANVGREDTDTSNSLGMPAKDFSKYSLVKAINAKMEGRSLDGIEAEISKEIEVRSGKTAQGFYFPIESAFGSNRTILDSVNTGTGAIPTILTPNFIEILRNRLVLVGLGATLMPDMVGNFSIPKQTQAGTAYWVAEGSPPTTSNQVVGQVAFTPKTVGAYTDISRKFLKNSIIPAEDFVRNDLARVIAIALETAALFGTGASNQPLGIVTNLVANYSGQIHSQGTNGAALAFTDVVSMETLVASQNADMGKLAYVTNAKVRASMKVTPKSASAVATGFIFDNGEANGYPVGVTNNVPSNGTKGSGTNLSTMVFGDISSLIFALWGGLDILVDPYTGSNSGTVRINAMQDVDINVRHPEAFSAITDIVA